MAEVGDGLPVQGEQVQAEVHAHVLHREVGGQERRQAAASVSLPLLLTQLQGRSVARAVRSERARNVPVQGRIQPMVWGLRNALWLRG